MELDRQKLIATVGAALGLDLLQLKTFELTLGKRLDGALTLKLHLLDDAPGKAKQAAEQLVAHFALPTPAPVPPEAKSGPQPGPSAAPVATLVAPLVPDPLWRPPKWP